MCLTVRRQDLSVCFRRVANTVGNDDCVRGGMHGGNAEDPGKKEEYGAPDRGLLIAALQYDPDYLLPNLSLG